MKKQRNDQASPTQHEKTERLSAWWRVGMSSLLLCAFLPSAKAELPTHDVAATSLSVVQPSTTDSNTIVVTAINSVNGFRSRLTTNSTTLNVTAGNNGDFDVQIGDDSLDDVASGILVSSVAENGRNNDGVRSYFAVSMIANNANGYFIPVNGSEGLGAGKNPEFNINVAGAWFPYATWLGGHAVNEANGGPLTVFTGSPSLTLGTHFIDNGGGRSVVDLTSLGIDSRTDGVLLVSGGKNESANFALSQVNTTNGTWNLFIKDVGAAGETSFEQDGIAFVFVPRTNTSVISGRFLGDGAIDMFSDVSPQFTVENAANGIYELKFPGRFTTNGVLIISAEGGGPTNIDNMVSYQPNAANDGYIIQTRDTPSPNVSTPAPLESPSPSEAVVSFVYIPTPTPGITAVPSGNLVTTEAGGTADFTVRLDTPPTADVTVSVVSSNPNEGVPSTSTLVFTTLDWDIPQPVTITGQDDAVADSGVAYNIVLTPTSSDPVYNGLSPVNISAINADDEPGVTITPTSGLVTTEEGQAATFSVRLNGAPSADVTVNFSSSDSNEGSVFPTSLTFNSGNWNQEQTVTVTGVDDATDDGDVNYSVISAPSTSADPAYNGFNAADVSVVNIDNDTASIIIDTLPVLTVTEAGSTASYTVVLQTKPTANVTVNVSSTDTTEGSVSPSTLTFTPANWNTPQPVTLTGVDDSIQDGSIDYAISNSFSSSDPLYNAFPPTSIPATTFDTEANILLTTVDTIYGLGMPPVGIIGRATIDDPYSTSYSGGTATISFTANGSADDRLEFRNTGNAAGQIGVSGNTVSFGGTAIATFTGGTGTTPLVINFNAASTPVSAEALLHAVTFRNVNSSPSLATRTVSLAFVDGDGGVSATVSKRIRVGLLRQSNFQEGADWGYGTYTGEADIQIHQPLPDTPFPMGNNTNNGLWINWPDEASANASQVLMRFDNIFGDNPGQIPADAVIVATELVLDVNDGGDGSPLYRMTTPWDSETTTWNSIGGGIIPGVQCQPFADSQIHVVDGSGSTGVGSISVSVTPDIIAWAGGEANYGWAMPGWFQRADGTGVNYGEAPNIADRPRLRVLWVPAGTASVSFRKDVNGYSGAFDTLIQQVNPDVNYAASDYVFCDGVVTGSSPNPGEVLLRFDNIVGTNPGQIPPNAQVHAAILDLASTGGSANGVGGQFYALLQPWDDTTTTWNSWVDGINTDGVEAAITPTVAAGSPTLRPFVQGGFNSFEVTSDVAAWARGTANYGWAIIPWLDGGDGWGIDLSESADEKNRPQLRVFYSINSNVEIGPLSVTPTSVTVQFTGVPDTSYSVQRSADVAGPYGTIGSATTTGTGSATFTDNSPLPGTGFYRISNP
jgi:hypothetical protein